MATRPLSKSWLATGCLGLLFLVVSGCASTTQNVQTTAPAPQTAAQPSNVTPERPIPYTVPYSNAFKRGLAQNTRTEKGVPGENYWQQEVDYDLEAQLFPAEKRLEGQVQIQYTNNSPDTLNTLHLDLIQNHHAPGVQRNRPAEVTNGMRLDQVTAQGQTLSSNRSIGPRYRINGTRLVVYPSAPVLPGETTTLEISYRFKIPQQGASGRMGYSDGLYYIGYWYPQMAVYDDLRGWHPDQYLGSAEFYYDFGDYNLALTVPDQWLVMASGTLQNKQDVLAPHVRKRLDKASTSDTPVAVVTKEDFNGGATASSSDGWHTWHFSADKVRDVAFSATLNSYWDAARTPVGDQDGDGQTDYIRADALYRSSAPRWKKSATYVQHAISFLSNYLDYPYPYPHMTAIEGGGIIGGGMEFPMMTLIGDYNNRSDNDLYAVTVHELAHMWVPMLLSTDERRHSWIDEGLTTFNENQGKKDFIPGSDFELNDQQTYLKYAGTDQEGRIMRRSNYHYSTTAFVIASYQKPASVLVALRAVLGEETFNKAYRKFIDAWAFKHPTPYDLFNTFETVSGQELDWFWRSWYFETWTLDQAVAKVTERGNQAQITVEDHGKATMPVHLTVHYKNGSTHEQTIPVTRWLQGYRTATVTVPASSPVEKVVIDEAKHFPDMDRTNNVWDKKKAANK